MSRTTQAILVVAVFIGTGFVTRALFTDWMNTVIKESATASEKETAKWRGNGPKFDGMKFDKPIKLSPTYEPTKFQPSKKKPNVR